MHTIELDITDSILSYHLYFDRRLNFIKGDSATGKTTLVDMILSEGVDPSVQLNCSYNCVVVNRTTWQSAIRTNTHSLIILDDLEVVSSIVFANAVKEFTIKNDLCFLIMTREDLADLADLDDCNNFKLVRNNNVYTLERYSNRKENQQ